MMLLSTIAAMFIISAVATIGIAVGVVAAITFAPLVLFMALLSVV